MKVHSLTILHYGKDYLPYALRSIYHSVDYCHIFYTPTPSHGHTTDIPPIETRDELMKAAFSYDPGQKIIWYDMMGVKQEGVQRDMALEVIKDNETDLVVVLDCDEVWPKGLLDRFLQRSLALGYRNNLVNMAHFWRSFNHVCLDDGWPVRIINLRSYNDGVKYLEADIGRVYHFGYAITDKVMHYKWKIHGHKNELRENWLTEKWNRVALNDIHPTNDKGFWHAKPFNRELLPEFMRDHPFYDLEIIK